MRLFACLAFLVLLSVLLLALVLVLLLLFFLVSKFRVVHVVGAVALLFVLVGGWWKPINASTRRYASHNEVIHLVGVAMRTRALRVAKGCERDEVTLCAASLRAS